GGTGVLVLLRRVFRLFRLFFRPGGFQLIRRGGGPVSRVRAQGRQIVAGVSGGVRMVSPERVPCSLGFLVGLNTGHRVTTGREGG
ncbi:hypothetical protein EBP14_25610, partial [Salmonella enterica subsp. enterica serovar Vitkin]|nr:hypothetical protein [Salmonella enterica subsp. enterica serovar Vitkin]